MSRTDWGLGTWLGILLVACGGKTVSDSAGAGGTTGASAPDFGGALAGGTPSGGSASGGTAGTGAVMGCYVAVQADACCTPPLAADSLASPDPCLVPYDDLYLNATLEACPDAQSCLWMNCIRVRPSSRVLTRDHAGACVVTDECVHAASDCVVASDRDRCCECPAVLPRVVVETDPCIVVGDEAPRIPCADCSSIRCAGCTGVLPNPACGPQGEFGLATCMAGVR
ncbi:MAG: hypothetical protein JW751_06935 [Polyangiaceae bacterium]|nr:hypothetical protein [Polyangiaceae bacterium]